MIRVLFVCLGNICRSPMGEAVFRDMVYKDHLASKIEVDSAGTAGWHTRKPPQHGTIDLPERHQITYQGIEARQVRQNDWEKFDYIIAMDEQNITDIKNEFAEKDGVVLTKLLDFVIESEEVDVPDPYYTGDFDYTYALVFSGCQNLLTHIRDKHSI